VAGGMPPKLPIPSGVEACYSPDGEYIAYTPLNDATQQWKHYRGGSHSRILVYRTKDHAVEQIPQPKERCNDLDPQWIAKTIYFRSDRNGEYNLFGYDTVTKEIKQLTDHKAFPVLNLRSGAGPITYHHTASLPPF